MDTPRSPSTPQSPIPLTSALRTHPKRGLPPTLSSTYPHGHISGHARTASQQRTFDVRKAEILRTMTAAQINTRYEEIVGKIQAVLEESRIAEEEIDREIERLKMEREMERRIWEKIRGKKEGG